MYSTTASYVYDYFITANDLQQLKNKDPKNKKLDKPKAYLNYVFFDKQFNFVSDGSGVKQVNGAPGQLETLASGKAVAKKNGYVYVFTSNESQQDVLFDNFGVMDVTGPVLEETHYYPFGLTMSGISTTAPLKLENRFKFQSQELQHKEFSDGSGLETYQFKYRMHDPQIGRFWQIDPLAGKYVTWSPYVFSGNRVINARELEGLEPYIITGRTFIPNKTVKNPVRMFSKIKSFKGDSRTSYQVTTKAYRTEQKVRVDFDNRKATTLSNRANFSIGLDENGTQIVKSKPGKAGPTPTYNKSSMKNGTTTVHMEVNASNKLVDGAPAINYEVDVTVTEQKNGTFEYKIQGESDGFPAYEFFITNEANGKSYLIYGNNPNHTGDSSTSLFPPMDENINENGNRADLEPVEKVKF